jgi:hypothetical protein
MNSSIVRAMFLLGICALPVLLAQHADAQATPGRQGPPSYYVLLTPGMLAGPVFSYPSATGKFRLEVRNLIVGHAKASDVPTPADGVMELRGGAVTTTINGHTQQRTEGDFWTVERGSQLEIENEGQVAVIRAVYVVPGAK